MSRPLSSFLYDHSGCIVLRSDYKKLILKAPARLKTEHPLFIKIYRHRTVHQRICNFLKRYRGGIKEYNISCRLKTRGIPVPNPVGACADHPITSLARRSLFATAWVPKAVSVRDLMVEKVFHEKRIAYRIARERLPYHGTRNINHAKHFLSEPSKRDEFTYALGQFIARTHLAGVWSNDLTAGNILVQFHGSNEFGFFLIDYERVCVAKTVPESKCYMNLNQMVAFLSQMDQNTARAICQGYQTIQHKFPLDDLIKVVEQGSSILKNRWRNTLEEKFELIGRNQL